MKTFHSCIIILVLGFAAQLSAQAQSTITFNLNLKPQIEDSVFIPGQDRAEVTGNLYPLGTNRNQLLQDTAPVDSIYSVEITFNRSQVGKTLQYNFKLQTANGEISEERPRAMNIQNQNQELDAIYFNAFAW